MKGACRRILAAAAIILVAGGAVASADFPAGVAIGPPPALVCSIMATLPPLSLWRKHP